MLPYLILRVIFLRAMSCVSSISSKRSRCEGFDDDFIHTPLKKCSKGYHEWSLSITTPATTPTGKPDYKRKTKSLDDDLISSPVKFGTDANVLNAEFQELSLQKLLVSLSTSDDSKSNPIFHIPELLHRIFNFLDHESLYRCSKVNPVWAAVASSIINKDLVIQQSSISGDLKIVELDQKVHPKSLTFYKLKQHRNFIENQLPRIRFTRLNSLNFYISPVLPAIFDDVTISNNLTKLTIAGNKKINDEELISLILGLPNLIDLDLRACSQISDISIVSIVTHCPKLQSINLGRHENSHLITDLSIMALSELEHLTTVGISGCDKISDVSIWQLYSKHSTTLVRLSINGCTQISDSSISDIVAKHGFPNLKVLDIRNCQLVRFKNLIQYRDWRHKYLMKPIHIHISDSMKKEFELQEQQLYKEFRTRIVNDLNRWVNEAT